MKDYEQLYFDSQYEIKQLKKENEKLKLELAAYKEFNGKRLNGYVISQMVSFMNNKLGNT